MEAKQNKETLSDKIHKREDYDDKLTYLELDVEDVKDFIKKLKEETLERAGEEGLGSYAIHKIIDKLAGEKLI
jgi:hypothetical protein